MMSSSICKAKQTQCTDIDTGISIGASLAMKPFLL